MSRLGLRRGKVSATLALVDEKRLTEVEIRYSYLEQLVRDLSQVMHEQQQALTQLTSRLERVERLIEEAMAEPGPQLPHEKPPHY